MKAKTPVKRGRRSSRSQMAEPAEIASEAPVVSSGTSSSSEHEGIARGGVATPFPWKLHEMLEDAMKEGNEWIVSWCPHGHSFIVHKPKIFVEKIMPTYFNQSKFASFQRQLNLYGFHRLTSGRDKGAYYHSCFVRGQVGLCKGMVRQKIKGTKVRRTLAPGEEPDFYKMTSIRADSPAKTSEEEMTPEDTVDLVTEETEDEIEPVNSEVRKEVLSAKERAHKLRHERLNAVRDALKQTEMFCQDDDANFEETLPSINLKPILPSVSPLESEVSDSEDDGSVFPPNRFHKVRPMPPLSNPPMLSFKMDPFAREAVAEPIKGGDVLFFEGKPFRYLEHLDSLPPPPPSSQAMQKPKQVPPTFAGFPRDSLQSLMRVDPQALMGAAATFH